MSISFQVNNGKVVKLKQTETFGDLFDNSGEKGKIGDFDFVYEGSILQVQKNTKLSQNFNGKDQVQIQIQKKGQFTQNTPFQGQTTQPGFPQPNLQPPTPSGFGQPPPSPFGQQPLQQPQTVNGGPPPSPFGQPQQQPQQPAFQQLQKPANQPINPPVPQPGAAKCPAFPGFPGTVQAPVVANTLAARKSISTVPNADKLSDLKQVDQFTVKICESGTRVELEDITNDFKAIFLEENAKPEKVQSIKQQLSPTAYITDPQQIGKLIVGVNGEYTKVIFKNDYRGIAIQWATGLYTLCEFNIQP